eukprot:917635-Pelagomonas_calceolata.AAC.2
MILALTSFIHKQHPDSTSRAHAPVCCSKKGPFISKSASQNLCKHQQHPDSTSRVLAKLHQAATNLDLWRAVLGMMRDWTTALVV